MTSKQSDKSIIPVEINRFSLLDMTEHWQQPGPPAANKSKTGEKTPKPKNI